MFLTKKEKIEKRIQDLQYYEKKYEEEQDMLNLLEDKIRYMTNDDMSAVFREYPNLYSVWLTICRQFNNSIEAKLRIRNEIKELEVELSILTSKTEP